MLVPKEKRIVNVWEKNIVPPVQSRRGNVPIAKNYLLNALLMVISFWIINYYILINLLDCCARRLLSVQPDFVSQKCEIEESITKSTNGKHHLVIYYPKYYYEFNHIKHFWYNTKKWAQKNCNYSLDDHHRCVPQALASVPNQIILAYFHCCWHKIDIYRERIGYGSSN